ncbi:MAG: YcgJ family protein [Cyanobium sp.]|nr:YcgJ family protein [Cyanobium sp.]
MSLAVLSTALLAGSLAMPLPSRSQAGSVGSPTKGVLCDRTGQICYDRQGVSLGLTRQYFGPDAERRLMAGLAGRPMPNEFRLSNGAVCSLPMQLCWSDGLSKRQISRDLTVALFGALPASMGGDKEVSRYSGFCTLAQGGRQLYDGPCALRRVNRDSSGTTRYVVEQKDGRRFNFSNRSGRLEVSDGTGEWPVAFFDHGYTGVFRWRDMTLVATREHRGLRQSRDSRVVMDQLFLDP